MPQRERNEEDGSWRANQPTNVETSCRYSILLTKFLTLGRSRPAHYCRHCFFQTTNLDKFYQMFVYRVSIVSRKNLTNRQITVPHGGLPSMFFYQFFSTNANPRAKQYHTYVLRYVSTYCFKTNTRYVKPISIKLI